MTHDLSPVPGRVFVGRLEGKMRMFTVKSVRRRTDGTPSSCILTWEALGEGVVGEFNVKLPSSGKLDGFRRVTLAQIGTARAVAERVGDEVPSDCVVIVTHDRTGGGPVVG